MRVLTVADVFPTKWGSFERYCVHLTTYLRAQGHEHHLSFTSDASPLVRAEFEKSDVVVVAEDFEHLGIRGSVALFIRAARLRADIVHLHFYDVVTLFPLLAVFLPAHCFVTYHISGPVSNPSSIKRSVKRLFGRLVGLSLEKVFSVSENNRNKLCDDYQISQSKVMVLHNGVALEDFVAKDWVHANPKTGLKLVCVAALIPEKGVHNAIRAVRLLKEDGLCVTLDIIGIGDFQRDLEALVGELHLEDSVTFLGQRDDIPSLLKGYDIALVPSVWEEAFGYTVIEAMAVGLPVVASRVGGIPEIIEDGVSGILVAPDSSEALKAGIERLLSEDGRLAQIGQQARSRVAAHFSIERQLKCLLDEYNKSLAQ